MSDGLGWLKNTSGTIFIGEVILKYIYAWSKRKCRSILIVMSIFNCHLFYFICQLLIKTAILVVFRVFILIITTNIFYFIAIRLLVLCPFNGATSIYIQVSILKLPRSYDSDGLRVVPCSNFGKNH